MCAEGAVVMGRVCQKWFVTLREGGVSLGDALRSGIPVAVARDPVKNSRCCTTREGADALKASKSIKSLGKRKNASVILWKKPHGLFGQSITYTT